jgi:hypothetical protein
MLPRRNHYVGLARLLTIALRTLTGWEGCGRHQQARQILVSQVASSLQPSTIWFTAKRLVQTLQEMNLAIVLVPGNLARHVTSPFPRFNSRFSSYVALLSSLSGLHCLLSICH